MFTATLTGTKLPDASLSWIIIQLNDDHGWSREQIADWLDTLVDLSFASPQESLDGENESVL